MTDARRTCPNCGTLRRATKPVHPPLLVVLAQNTLDANLALRKAKRLARSGDAFKGHKTRRAPIIAKMHAMRAELGL